MKMDMSTNTIQSINWGGAEFPSYQGFMNTPAAAAPTDGGGAASGAGAGTGSGVTAGGSPAAGSTSASPGTTGGGNGGSPTPAGQGNGNGGQSAASAVDWATAPAHFRSEYEKVQAQLARFTGLGEYETVQSHAQFVQGIVSEAYKVGESLGYTTQQIQTALQDDAVETIQFLRGRAAQAGQGRTNGQGQGQGQGRDDQGKNIESLVKKHLAPVEQHINNQMTEAANGLFGQEVQRLFAADFPDHADMPAEYRQLLFDATSEMMKYDSEGLSRLKFERKVSDVAKHYTKVKTAVDLAFTKFQQYQNKKAGRPNPDANGQGAGAGDGQGGAKPGLSGLSLDDVIFGDERAVAAIPSMRR